MKAVVIVPTVIHFIAAEIVPTTMSYRVMAAQRVIGTREVTNDRVLSERVSGV